MIAGVEEDLGQRHVEMLTDSGPLPLVQRGAHGTDAEVPAVEVGVLVDFGDRWLPAQPRRHFDGAAFGVQEGRMGAPFRPDTRLTETTDGEVDKPWIARRQRGVPEPATGEGTGPEVLDEDVTLLGHAADQLRAGFRTDVRTHMALSGVHLRVQGTDAVHDRRYGPAEITAGRFDLEDLGAQVRQDPATCRTGDDLRQVEDAHPFEGTW